MPGTAQSGGRSAGKTRAQHERDGTYRKDRHSALRTPEPPAGRPEIPASLSESAQAEWERMLWRLEQSQSLWKVDDGTIYQYCKLYAETEAVAEQQSEAQASLRLLEDNLSDIQAEDKVQLFSQIVTLHKTISKCTDQLRSGRMAIRQYLVEFGLTPAARGRVKLPSQKQEVDDFTAFQQRRVS